MPDSGAVMAERRRAQPGELCVCGRPAVEVLEGDGRTPTGYCGRPDGGAPVDGVCTFCGDTIDHDHYWRTETDAHRDAASPSSQPQGGRCPLYRVRLADPLPALHAESVRPFDRHVGSSQLAEARLRQELMALFSDLGADFEAERTLDDGDAGDLEDVVFDIVWATGQLLGRDGDETTTDPAAGQSAVAALVLALRPRLDELGTSPNPLVGLDDAAAVLDGVGGVQAWEETVGRDRPLLVLRRIVRRAVTPEAPWDIYQEWWA